MKHRLKSVSTLAATLITFGSLAGGANGAVVFTADGGDLVANISTPISWTIDGSQGALVLYGIAFKDASSGVVSPANSPGGGTSTLTIDSQTNSNISSGRPGDLSVANITSTTAWMLYGFTPDVAVDIGDQVTLSAGTIVWQGSAGQLANMVTPFTGEVFLFNGSTGTAIGSVVTVPEPSSSLLLGLGVLGVVIRRRRTT
jgi:hypothetical protein